MPGTDPYVPAVVDCGGTSVREVIASCERVTGKKIAVVEKARRPGDPARLIAGSDKIQGELGWKPKFQSIDRIIEIAAPAAHVCKGDAA